MTGILPISKYSSGSDLNMFFEYSMATRVKYSEYFGFTDEEVDELYQRYLKTEKGSKVTREGLELWYDGYPHLSKAMQHFKDTQKGRDEMCNVIEEYANEIADERELKRMIKTCIMLNASKEKTIEMVCSEFPQIPEEQISKRVEELWDN